MCSACAGGKIKCHSVRQNRILSPIKTLKGYRVFSMGEEFWPPRFHFIAGTHKRALEINA